MKERSIKVQLTLWYAALMALMAAMVLGFVLIFFAVICSETKFAFLRKKRVDKV